MKHVCFDLAGPLLGLTLPPAIRVTATMHRQTINPRLPPACPACGIQMQHARSIEQEGERINVFDYSACRMNYTAREGGALTTNSSAENSRIQNDDRSVLISLARAVAGLARQLLLPAPAEQGLKHHLGRCLHHKHRIARHVYAHFTALTRLYQTSESVH